MKRVGLMGGTFDPIHMGHLLLAEQAREELHLDEVRFIPSGVSYLKSDREDKVLSSELRYKMTELAVQDSCFTVSDIEIKRAGNTYTADTLEELAEAEPETEFVFLCGADSVMYMDNWYHPERIFAHASIGAAIRDGQVNRADFEKKARELQEKYGARIDLLTSREFAVSSTEIRNRVKNGKSIRYLVPASVETFIHENGLYGSVPSFD